MEGQIRLIIIDDHPLFREGFKSVVKMDSRFDIVGEADNGTAGLELAVRVASDIILTDISMPEMDGIKLTRKLKTALPKAKVVILTMHTGINHISIALQAGADGYLVKDSPIEELLDQIAAIAEERFSPGSNLPQSIAKEVTGVQLLEHRKIRKAYEKLTPREQQVMRGLVTESSPSQLAAKLSISSKTVENHRSNIMRKLGLNREIELLRFAARIGLIDLDI